jgi:hypothetical protein
VQVRPLLYSRERQNPVRQTINPVTGELEDEDFRDPSLFTTIAECQAELKRLNRRWAEDRQNLIEAQDQVRGLQRDIRGWATRYANLKRDQEEEARSEETWQVGEQVFDFWRRECKHPRSKFTLDRYELVRPFLRQYGVIACLQAIKGASYDPFTTQNRNGATIRHDGWELIFRNAGKVEAFANKCPRGWNPPGWANPTPDSQRQADTQGAADPGEQTSRA